MKITKNKPVNASVQTPAVVVEDPAIATVDVVVEEVCSYQNAINLIAAAIESLAEVAKDDQIAKDSIANLGVVMLDLKGGCK